MFAFCRGSFAAYFCAGEILAREMGVLNGPRRAGGHFSGIQKIVYLGWPPLQPREEKSQDSVARSCSGPRTTGLGRGTGRYHGEVPPPPCTTSRIDSPERKLCYTTTLCVRMTPVVPRPNKVRLTESDTNS